MRSRRMRSPVPEVAIKSVEWRLTFLSGTLPRLAIRTIPDTV